MGFWSDLKASINEATEALQTKMAQYKNANFADASMAMCAMVAAADGTIDSSERQKTFKAISSNKLLQVFEMRELKVQFDQHCEDLTDDFDFGKMNCLDAIRKVKGKEGQDRAVIQIGVIIGGADGDFDADERAVVREACMTLGIDPTSFDL